MLINTVRIRSEMPTRPDWVKVNSTISFPLTSNDIQKLGSAFSEAQKAGGAYANVEVSFTGGLNITLGVEFESR